MSRTTPVQLFKQPNAPDQSVRAGPDNPIPWIDDLWIDIVSHQLKQCTSINPYVWVAVIGAGPSLNDAFVTWQSSADLTNQKTIGPFLSSVLTTTLTFARGGTLLSPAQAVNATVWRAPFACTVTNVRGFLTGSTGSTINARQNGTLTHLASDLILSSAGSWLDGGAVQNTAYSPGDSLDIMLTGVTGSPAEIAIQVDFTRP